MHAATETELLLVKRTFRSPASSSSIFVTQGFADSSFSLLALGHLFVYCVISSFYRLFLFASCFRA